MEDRLVWQYTSDGKYSVKSGYHLLLMQQVPFGPHRFIWKRIWNTRILPKIKLFTWRICHGIVPTRSMLAGRITGADPRCPRCGQNEETVVHAIMDCGSARTLLSRFCPKLFSDNITNDTFQIIDWIEYAARRLSIEEFETFLTTLWALWYARNSEIHHNSKIEETNLMNFITGLQMEVKAVNGPLNLYPASYSRVCWQAPDRNVYKVNFDGALKVQQRQGGAGVVIRDSEGFVMGAAALRIDHCTDPIMVEAIAALKAIEVSIQMGFQNVILEGDALTVIRKLQLEEDDLSIIRPIMEYGRNLMKTFWSCTVQHVARQGNEVAHILAKHSLNVSNDCYWIEEYPNVIHQAVMNDAINI